MINSEFVSTVWEYYYAHKRQLPWRSIRHLTDSERSYIVLVSEIMLQQTQVQRVVTAYNNWMHRWPTLADFATASIGETITQWSGLGYNRRAKYLFESLRMLDRSYNGVLPKNEAILMKLPGVGSNTAGALRVYTHNLPSVFVETNIRSAYIYAFYKTLSQKVSDKDIRQKVNDTVDTMNPREWYYALMDYGAYIKKTYGSQLQYAAAHKKQPSFAGSWRQLRGKVIHQLTLHTDLSFDDLQNTIQDRRLLQVLQQLESEQLIHQIIPSQYSIEPHQML